jgi:hypothetical protein
MKTTIAEENQTLFKATVKLHHDAELHPFGAAMSSGELSEQQWADWLGAMLQIYVALDPYLPPFIQRAKDLFVDLLDLSNREIYPEHSIVAEEVVHLIKSNPSDMGIIAGLSYILSGANLRGGQVIRKILEKKGYVCNHLTFSDDDRIEAEKWLDTLRSTKGQVIIDGSKKAFEDVIALMDELWDRTSN